jgi:hypothetical protein
MSNTTTTATPGYRSRLNIRLFTDKKGRPRALQCSFGIGLCSGRWFPIARDKAEMFLAMDQAWLYEAPATKVY